MSDEPKTEAEVGDLREITIEQLEGDGGALEDYIRSQLDTKPQEFRFRFQDPEEGVSLTLMPVPRCDACRWWRRDRPPIRGDKRACEKLTGNGGSLLTECFASPPGFGCTEWEAKEDE